MSHPPFWIISSASPFHQPRRHSRVGVSKIIGAKRSLGSQQTGRTILQNLRLLSSRNRWKDFDSEGEMRLCALEIRCSYCSCYEYYEWPCWTVGHCNIHRRSAPKQVTCSIHPWNLRLWICTPGRWWIWCFTVQECTGYHRQQVDPWPKSYAKSDGMIFTGNSDRNPRICGPLFWVDPPVGFVQKRINFGGTVPLPPFPSSAVGTRGPHRGGLGEVAQWQEDARLPNLCRPDELRRWLSFWTDLKPRNRLAHICSHEGTGKRAWYQDISGDSLYQAKSKPFNFHPEPWLRWVPARWVINVLLGRYLRVDPPSSNDAPAMESSHWRQAFKIVLKKLCPITWAQIQGSQRSHIWYGECESLDHPMWTQQRHAETTTEMPHLGLRII